ncbi:transporter [Streptomyces sp. NPDC047999]|uniref:transporter n=1 Tax=Streptomyces sp. NPDC047999 TaxID=3365497 RepID=UPI00371ED894
MSTARLTGILVRLKLSLLRGGLRRSGGRTAVFVVSLVFASLAAAGLLLGLVLLRGHAQAATVAVLLAGVLAAGWAVLPLFFPGGDETLDPSRLVMLPLRPGPLVAALLGASVVGIGPLVTLCLAVGAVLAVAHGAAAAVAAVAAVPLLLLVCLALARAVAAANIRLLTSRKGRDLALLSGLLIAVGLQFLNFGLQNLGRAGGLSALRPAAEVVGWLPPAAAVAAVDAAGEGAYGEAAARLLLTGLALAGLLWWWQRSLTRLMTSPDSSTLGAAPTRDRSSSGLHRLLPEGRTGAVVLRTLRYAWRDPKTKGAWVTALAIGLIVPVLNALQGTGSVYFACFGAAMLGMLTYNQFGQDHSGFWMVAQTISTARDAYQELRARALAILLVTVPYTVLVAAVTAAVMDRWDAVPEVVGLSFALLGAMLATGALASALFPYSIPQDSAYKNVAPGQGAIAWLSLGGGLVASLVTALPVLALAVWLHLSGSGALWTVLPAGAAYGALTAWAGVRLAATRTADRLPEILAAVTRG